VSVVVTLHFWLQTESDGPNRKISIKRMQISPSALTKSFTTVFGNERAEKGLDVSFNTQLTHSPGRQKRDLMSHSILGGRTPLHVYGRATGSKILGHWLGCSSLISDSSCCNNIQIECGNEGT
jgi:hypothetical protein